MQMDVPNIIVKSDLKYIMKHFLHHHFYHIYFYLFEQNYSNPPKCGKLPNIHGGGGVFVKISEMRVTNTR